MEVVDKENSQPQPIFPSKTIGRGKKIAAVPKSADIDVAPSAAAVVLPAIETSKGAPRLMMTQMVLENFKSYGGKQVIGPFHSVCTLISCLSNEILEFHFCGWT